MRLAEDLFLVGGGAFNGFGLSTAQDSHVYAVASGEDILLVDCGMDHEGGLDAIWRNLREDGLDPERITHIALTHYHIDHCGGLRSWLERVPATVVAGAETLTALAAGDAEATGFALAQAGGLYPDDYHFRPVPDLDDVLGYGPFRFGETTAEAVPAPGHCAGHAVFAVPGRAGNYLFTGDCVFHGGRIALLNTPDCSLDEYRSTIADLARRPVDALLPGHGALAMRDGAEHIGAAAAAFRSLLLPESLT